MSIVYPCGVDFLLLVCCCVPYFPFPAQHLNIGIFKDSVVMCVSVRFCLHHGCQKWTGIPPSSLAVCVAGRINSLGPCSNSQPRASDLLSLNLATPRLPFNKLLLWDMDLGINFLFDDFLFHFSAFARTPIIHMLFLIRQPSNFLCTFLPVLFAQNYWSFFQFYILI